jgi:transcription elongation factor Elf1
MKVKVIKTTPQKVLQIQPPKHRKIKKPGILFPTLIRILSSFDMLATKFSYTTERMDKAGKGPWLILMNHSSFIDLKIASKLFYPKRYLIVTTFDAFIGKGWLMQQLGCIPTPKFTADITLAKYIFTAIKDKKINVLLYPEAGYTFDGTSTTLPKSLGSIVKRLGVPVVSVITDGAFLRQPLYNELRTRKVKTSATVKCLLTPEEIQQKSVEEINGDIAKEFSFDNFRTQYENKTVIDDPERATGLHRVLYRCPHCNTEGKTEGKGARLTCHACGKTYEMDVYGQLSAISGETEYSHVPDWYDWQRECVKKEIEDGTYLIDTDVDIAVQVNLDGVCMIGQGHLTHNAEGFHLTNADGKLDYKQSPIFSHTLYSDYYWYEIGDVIGIGDNEFSYFCFPKENVSVSKARLATEELYKMKKPERRLRSREK